MVVVSRDSRGEDGCCESRQSEEKMVIVNRDSQR